MTDSDWRLTDWPPDCLAEQDLEGKPAQRDQTLVGTEWTDAPELAEARAHHHGR